MSSHLFSSLLVRLIVDVQLGELALDMDALSRERYEIHSTTLIPCKAEKIFDWTF